MQTKEGGGLGIIDLERQNEALLMKHLDKFYNHANVPWVSLTWSKFYSNTNTPPQARSPVGSFWWKEILKLFRQFKQFSFCVPNKGNSDLLYDGNWSGEPLKEKYP
jgi:hypothetical protein